MTACGHGSIADLDWQENLGRKEYRRRMIVDEAFFGFARVGTINGSFSYPGILKSGDIKQLFRRGNTLDILGQSATKQEIASVEDDPSGGKLSVWVSDDIVVIPDGAELVQRPKKLMERIRRVRKHAGYGKLLYLQGVSDPYLIPMLVYSGISLFDDSTLRIESQKSVVYTVFGRSETGENPYSHNIGFVEEILELLGRSIRSATIREVVEKYQVSSKALELLRIIDNDEDGESESTFPRRTPYIKANSLESLRRPDLTRYREYISGSYVKPDYKKIALLIPCSARKPYSTSKSHKQILDALKGLRHTVHEIIVTSPVGLVPRELEGTYPANAYNIPVIGEWYEDEKKMINSMLGDYFARNHYQKVYTFVKEDLDFIKDVLPEGSEQIQWEEKKESLNRLRETIQSAVLETGKLERKVNHKLETYVKIAQYQFGNWITPYLDGTRIIKNYNTEMLVKGGKPVLVFNDRIGKFTIHKNAAQWFLDNGKFLVEIDDFKPTANIYAVGVNGTTNDIRQEDEVVIHHKGSLKGVGIAKMPYAAMIGLMKGTAVKVRN